MTEPLKIIYAGTPDFAVPALQALIDSPHEVVAVYTQPDRPAGRGQKVRFSPVKQTALAANIPVEQTTTLKTAQAQQQLRDYQADVMVVAAYSLILPQAVLDIPRFGCLNIHGSLLPRWRGAAPIQRAIQADDKETGVTIMQMTAGLDTGDMLHKIVCPIDHHGAQAIHDQLANDGATGLIHVLEQLCTQGLTPIVQDNSQATYAHKLQKADGEINWQASAKTIDCMIRAFDAWPTAYTYYRGKVLKIMQAIVLDEPANTVEAGHILAESKAGIDVSTGQGVLRIQQLQLAGSKRMDAAAFLNARSLLGERFPS
ncbi:MAG: methionyl-tRNA formyltransferase [bacterium]